MFQLRRFSEEDFDKAINDAGGRRAHTDADKRKNKGADYVLGNSLIELKLLQEEGLQKTDRQSKLASLFLQYEQPKRPVVILDRNRLNEVDRRKYDRIIEGPIKSAVAKARKQLPVSRAEISNINCSVLLLINDGYTAIDHDTLLRLAEHRVKQDTTKIDAVVVAGSFIHGDGFELFSLWPINCIQINPSADFKEFERLKSVWHKLAETFMTECVKGVPEKAESKSVKVDLNFDHDGVRFVMPAPRLGKGSDFYKHGRPREGDTDSHQPVATIFPKFDRENWDEVFNKATPSDFPVKNFDAWEVEFELAEKNADQLSPLIEIDIQSHELKIWCERENKTASYDAISGFALDQFNKKISLTLEDISEFSDLPDVIPSSFILVITEQIGQCFENDVSHIYRMDVQLNAEYRQVEILTNLNITKNHAVRLAAAYALKQDVYSVYWMTDNKYLWF